MSKLNRALIRLNKAIQVMNSVEQNTSDKRPLTIGSDLTRILRDIPAKNLKQMYDKRGLTEEWETIATAARTVSLTKDDANEVGTVHSHLPCDDDFNFENFQRRWSGMLNDNSKDVHDFLDLLEVKALNFCV
jgi:hypothetical protein